MDQVHVIRHKVLVDGRSAGQVAKELGISRRTVRKYLTQAVPQRPEAGPRARPVWDKVRTRVEALLTELSQWTGGKQQLTATRLHELLMADGHQVGVTLVKEAVADGNARGVRYSYPSRTDRAISPRLISSRCSSISTACGARRGCFSCG